MPVTKKTKGDWIGAALSAKGKKGKPRGEGTLTAQAASHSMSIPAFANEVEMYPESFDKITKQRVNLYRTLRKIS